MQKMPGLFGGEPRRVGIALGIREVVMVGAEGRDFGHGYIFICARV